MTERMGRYELIAPRPGLDNTFIARRRGAGAFERFVVVKVINLAGDDEPILRLRADEHLWPLGRLHHHHFRNLLDVEEHDNKLLIVSEYVHGPTAREVIDVGAHLPYDFGLTVVAHAAAALHHMHTRQVNGKPLLMAHRELSPSMLHISYEGAVKVALPTNKLTKTRAGQPSTGFEYLTPEHVLGKPVDLRSDVFTLGSVLYELTTGKRAFREPSERLTLARIKGAAYVPPSQVIGGYPPELEAIIVKALQADPAERYDSAEAMRNAIAALGHHYELVLGDAAIVEVISQLFETPREPWQQVNEPTVDAAPAYDFELPSVRPRKSPMRSATELVEELSVLLETPTNRPLTPEPIVREEIVDPPSAGINEFEDAKPTTLAPPPAALIAATAVAQPKEQAKEPEDPVERVRSIERLFTAGFDARETPAIPIASITDEPTTRALTNRGVMDLGVTTDGVEVISETAIKPPVPQPAPPPSSSGKRIAIIAIALIVLGGLGIGGYLFATRDDGSTAVADAPASTPADSGTPDSSPDAAVRDATTPDTAPDAPPGMITLKLTSVPSGASVVVDNKKIGRTPFEGTIELGNGKKVLKVRYEGYNTFRHELTGDLEREVKLTKPKAEPKPDGAE